MTQLIETQIDACENRLKHAMLNSDVKALDELLAPNLIFTNHLGALMTKQQDLDAHHLGLLKINDISLSDNKTLVCHDVVVVSVQAFIKGSFNGSASESTFRFTRVWAKAGSDKWQVIAAHSCLVV